MSSTFYCGLDPRSLEKYDKYVWSSSSKVVFKAKVRYINEKYLVLVELDNFLFSPDSWWSRSCGSGTFLPLGTLSTARLVFSGSSPLTIWNWRSWASVDKLQWARAYGSILCGRWRWAWGLTIATMSTYSSRGRVPKVCWWTGCNKNRCIGRTCTPFMLFRTQFIAWLYYIFWWLFRESWRLWTFFLATIGTCSFVGLSLGGRRRRYYWFEIIDDRFYRFWRQ